MDISIVIPCFNEVENLPKLHSDLFPIIEKMAEYSSVELVLVDDGSKDGTLPALKKLIENTPPRGVTVKFGIHEKNQGVGAALRTAFGIATGDLIITTDNDGTYKFVNIPLILNAMVNGIDIVTASPYHPKGSVAGVPAYRLILSKGSSLIYRILVDWDIHTWTSLFRVYRKEVVCSVTFSSNGFLGGTELLVKAIFKGYRVAEFPTILYSRELGTSKIKLFQTICAHLRFQLSILSNRELRSSRGT